MVLIIKNVLANTGDVRDAESIPGSGRSPGRDHSPERGDISFVKKQL